MKKFSWLNIITTTTTRSEKSALMQTYFHSNQYNNILLLADEYLDMHYVTAFSRNPISGSAIIKIIGAQLTKW